MKLLIEISKEVKQAFDCAESNDLKAGYYDLGGVIGAAIKNGKPLDSVLDKIKAEITDKSYLSYDDNPRHIIDESWVLEIIDKYRKGSDGK